MKRIQAEWGLMLFLTTGAVLAGEVQSGAEEAPSMELLEFLGGFETPEGAWLDPLLLVDDREARQDDVEQEYD
ncbi:MAG: hypothetical protein JAY99_17050 [Candidatus Thiodiazotropha lotti]|uniref:Uncharacterized protein n=1 Tax=Candidatus Thiodiazotropha endoloripes TaxID=1818881 RepID=A0A1E2UPC5_9GAMM|nr:hypothetical protein [Candidatus Thiodiazotropha endoloripes]MCG7897129.1 hypothetical protein [Candidatus Thiodiazotropha weberae]MCG7993616.1 hypothetical protein [Candidatus Thiodiazotropha lotti]MCG7903853.1 hypothetical protein [Candidatus Thiodiazotropha weberae]MCG8001230.1 hypothetical protein [Candidatus Thiodiazotropha lotti]MCW4185280.1 hypothetical protein [Candidatus Thiodiazotropha weberae]